MATKVITGVNTRWSYANVWEPKAMEGMVLCQRMGTKGYGRRQA